MIHGVKENNDPGEDQEILLIKLSKHKPNQTHTKDWDSKNQKNQKKRISIEIMSALKSTGISITEDFTPTERAIGTIRDSGAL